MLTPKKVSILLVDGNARLRDHIKDMLRDTEFTLWEAADGATAERFLASPKLAVDILLADVTLDHSGGWDLAIQCASVRPRTKVLLMSSRYLDAVQNHGLYVRQGLYLRGVAFLPKPFGREDLVSRLRDLWKHGPTVRLESTSGSSLLGREAGAHEAGTP